MEEPPPKQNRTSLSGISRDFKPLMNPMEILRQHFESQFEPLPIMEPVMEHRCVEEYTDDEFSTDEWTGFSDDERVLEVVEYNFSERQKSVPLEISGAETKAFMVIFHNPLYH